MEKVVLPIHFEDRSGIEFERLVFAYLSRTKDWNRIGWLGQTGNDGGRDIWGDFSNESYCYQCANYRRLHFDKVKQDIDKLIANQTLPNHFAVVCGGTVSAQIRKKIIEYAQKASINFVEVWSGVELEEKIRANHPALIKRFVEGETFPDEPSQLINFPKVYSVPNDDEIISLLSECLDRPAFTTRFQEETSIKDFEQALDNTIEVFNTGIHRLRDGTEIRRIPSRHQVNNKLFRDQLAEITKLISRLKSNYILLKHSGDIQPCGCGKNDCPVMSFSQKACDIMDESRNLILREFRKLKPDFNVHIY